VRLQQEYFAFLDAHGVEEHELQRAKNKLYIELLQHESQNDVIQAVGNQFLFFDRRITRTEIARRVSDYDSQQIQRVIRKWVVGKKFTTTIWGDKENLKQY